MHQTNSPVEARLDELGLTVPAPIPPVANFTPVVITGNLAYVSGQGPYRNGSLAYIGRVDSQITVADAKDAARLVALTCLGALKAQLRSLDRVSRVVKLLGMVNSDPSFTRQPEIIDAASDLLVAAFGERGRHARSSIGVAVLPANIPVEIEMIVEIEGS